MCKVWRMRKEITLGQLRNEYERVKIAMMMLEEAGTIGRIIVNITPELSLHVVSSKSIFLEQYTEGSLHSEIVKNNDVREALHKIQKENK